MTLVEVPAMAISSTDCRTRVAEGRPVWYLVPDGVVQYISKRHLYRDAKPGRVRPDRVGQTPRTPRSGTCGIVHSPICATRLVPPGPGYGKVCADCEGEGHDRGRGDAAGWY